MIAKKAKSEQFDVNSSDENHSKRVSDSEAKTWTTITANLAVSTDKEGKKLIQTHLSGT